MALDDIHFQPLTKVAKHIENRDISPVEVTEAILARIDRLNPRLNAYLTVTAARVAELRGEPLDVLAQRSSDNARRLLRIG